MKRSTTLIRGGLCVLPGAMSTANILVEGETVKSVSAPADSKADSIIDAAGSIVMPGGIDPHVHFHLPLAGGIYSADDFKSGSLAALAGGTTTIIDFITPVPGDNSKAAQSLEEAAEQRIAEAGKAFCDYSFHFSAVKGMKHVKDQLKTCRDRFSINSCKMYFAYQDTIGLNDREAFDVFKAAGELGIVLLIHCEWGEAVDYLRKQISEKGVNNPAAHALTRPAWAERQAIAKACAMAEICGTEIYIVHISTAEGIGEVLKARQRGVKVYAEVCLHHLLLDDSLYQGNQARLYFMSPPLRPASQKMALWQYLKAGYFDAVSTDHCPFSKKEKLTPELFTAVPNGVNGVEERLKLFITQATGQHGFSMEEASAYLSAGAAAVFKPENKSGTISEGADADLVIIAADKGAGISAETHHSLSDYNCYEGLAADIRIKTVLRRGEQVITDGEISPDPGKGKILKTGI